jgi:hypothetical protein
MNIELYQQSYSAIFAMSTVGLKAIYGVGGEVSDHHRRHHRWQIEDSVEE